MCHVNNVNNGYFFSKNQRESTSKSDFSVKISLLLREFHEV